jgi:hypothetical protein
MRDSSSPLLLRMTALSSFSAACSAPPKSRLPAPIRPVPRTVCGCKLCGVRDLEITRRHGNGWAKAPPFQTRGEKSRLARPSAEFGKKMTQFLDSANRKSLNRSMARWPDEPVPYRSPNSSTAMVSKSSRALAGICRTNPPAASVTSPVLPSFKKRTDFTLPGSGGSARNASCQSRM